MAIGDSGKYGWNSYIGVAKETTFGTHVTATSFMEFNSESINKTIDEMRLPSINKSRDYIKRIQTNISVDGTIEADLDVGSDAIVNMMKQAMGGTCSSAQIAATTAYAHTLNLGDMESNASTATASDMKGVSITKCVGGTLFQVDGARVNQMTISGTIGEPIKVSFDILAKDMTTTADSLTVAYSDTIPLIFHGVSIKNADNIGSITSGTTETFIGFELSINNNIDNGDDARSLGSKTVSILPAFDREINLTLAQRFDTTTAYDRFVQTCPDSFAFQILMDSCQTIGAAGSSTYSMHINVPKVYYNTPTPQAGDKGIITWDLALSAVKENTTTGYALQMQVNNATTSYE